MTLNEQRKDELLKHKASIISHNPSTSESVAKVVVQRDCSSDQCLNLLTYIKNTVPPPQSMSHSVNVHGILHEVSKKSKLTLTKKFTVWIKHLLPLQNH
jgi:hypothetical protein